MEGPVRGSVGVTNCHLGLAPRPKTAALAGKTVLSGCLWLASRGRQRHTPGGRRAQHPCTPPKKESARTPARPEEAIRAKSALEFRFSHRTSLLRPRLGRCVTPSVCRTVVHVPRLSLGQGAHSAAETRGRWAPSSEHPGPHVRPASSRLCPSLQASDGAAAPAD